MEPSMKGLIRTERNMERELLPLQMEVIITENFKPMKFVEQESTTGQMESSTKESGKRIKCMDTGCWCGKMERSMMENL